MKSNRKNAFLVTLFSVFFLANASVIAQPCFPFGKTLSSQEEIDDFFTDYPGCTVIEGSLVIDDLDDGTIDIQNLEGLSGITEFQSNLEFFGCWQLNDFSGMNQVSRIEGKLDIQSNDQFLNFFGFDQLDTIGGNLIIFNNDNLRSLEGFTQLRGIGGSLSISGNPLLMLDSGLDSLRSVGSLRIKQGAMTEMDMFNELERVEGFVWIGDNPHLKSINGFKKLSYIRDEFEIYDNDSLEYIHGFDQLKEIGDFFQILNSPRLVEISPFSQLNKIGGDLYLFNNPMLEGFQSGFSALDTIKGMLYLDFNANLKHLTFPSLKYIGADLAIYYHDSLEVLDGFPELEEVGGPLFISDNPMITTISGFNQLKKVGGQVKITNHLNLQDFTGFQQLQFIDGTLTITNNSLLTGIDNLGNLESLGGSLIIRDNAQLNSISGLSNIDPESIVPGDEVGVYQELVIYRNPMLDACAIESICSYFDQEETDAYINENGGPCESEWDIINACTVAVDALGNSKIDVFPVPAINHLNIDLDGIEETLVQVELISWDGKVDSRAPLEKTNRFYMLDTGNLPPGFYVLRLVFEHSTQSVKVVVDR